MKLIKLTKGQFAKVDDDEFERLSQFKWYACLDTNGKFYAQRKIRVDKSTRKTVKMHRQIAGTKLGGQTDHINGDTLDNQSANLRICTKSENGMNRGIQKNNTSGFKGVSFFKRGLKYGKPWVASVKKEWIRKYVGVYETAIEAAQAYDKAAKELHGDFAKLNFPSVK